MVVIGAPLVVAGVICYLLSFYAGDLVRLVLFLLSPLAVFIVAIVSLEYVYDPNSGCTYDCSGRVVYLIGGVAAIVGAELGTAAGWLGAWLKTRRSSPA